MRVIRKILYAIMILSALLCLFIIVCAFKPDITEQIKGALYRDTAADTHYVYDGGSETKSIAIPPTSDNAGSEETDRSAESMEVEGDGLRNDNTADYIAPSESELSVPDNVSGRNGYRQIQGEAEQIDDAAADDIQGQLDVGYTGDGLDFDSVYYPYYAMLDDRGKHVYRQIYANADAVCPAFTPIEEVTSAQLRNIFAAVYNDHPELFWLETAYAFKYISTGRCVEIDLRFNRTAQELDSAKTVFNNQAAGIIAEAQNLADDYAKEKFVHDQLIGRISYNAHAEMNQSAYSALVNSQTVCAGYARAFQHILMQLGIPCYYCTGYAGESHAWNIVGLSDGFYNVDTTWDDTGGGNYDYFNKTDEDYANTHIRKEMSVYLPPCGGQMYRNLEQSNETAADDDVSQNLPRSLAETGISEDQVYADMGRYYENCYDQVVQNGIGHYTFCNVVANQQMRDELYQSYSDYSCWEIYLENATNAVGASYCRWQISSEELQGGMYMITHEIRMTK